MHRALQKIRVGLGFGRQRYKLGKAHWIKSERRAHDLLRGIHKIPLEILDIESQPIIVERYDIKDGKGKGTEIDRAYTERFVL